MYFIYNNLSSSISFNDIGLVIPANDFFEIDVSIKNSFFDGCSLDVALINGSVIICTSDSNNPPESQDILTLYRAQYILSAKESAFEIAYDDTETSLGADNVQTAIKKIVDGGSAGGITPSQHRTLDQLVHNLAENYFYEAAKTAGQVTAETWWVDSGKTQKLKEITYNYNGNKINQAITVLYDDAGVAITGETLTETFAWTGNYISSVTAILS